MSQIEGGSINSIAWSPVSNIKRLILVALIFCVLAVISAGSVDIGNILIARGDGIIQYYPDKTFAATSQNWNPYICNGYPAFADPQTQRFYPLSFIFAVLPDVINYNVFILIHIVLAGFFMFLYLRSCRLIESAAFVGGAIFMLGGFLAISVDLVTVLCVVAWTPFLFFAVEQFWQTHSRWYLLFTSIGVYCLITAGHPQVMFYTMLVCVLYVLFSAVYRSNDRVRQRIKRIGEVFLFMIFGVGLAGVILLPTMRLARESVRSDMNYATFTWYSCRLYKLILMVFPRFLNTPEGTVVSRQFCGGYYIGILGLSLAISAFWLWRRREKLIWFWSIIAMLGLLLSLGRYNPVYRVLHVLPGFSSFRVPSRHVFEWTLGTAILAAISLHYLMGRGENSHKAKALLQKLGKLWIIMASVSMILFFVIRRLISERAPDVLANPVLDSIRLSSPSRSLAFLILIIAGLLLYFFHSLRKFKYSYIIIALFVVIELFASGFFWEVDYRESLQKTKRESYSQINAALSNDKELTSKNYRVFGFVRGASSLSENLNSMHGYLSPNFYGPLIPSDYRTMIPNLSSFRFVNYEWLLANNNMLSALSTKYIFVDDPITKRIMDDLIVEAPLSVKIDMLLKNKKKIKDIPIKIDLSWLKGMLPNEELSLSGGNKKRHIFRVKVIPGKNYVLRFNAFVKQRAKDALKIIAGDQKFNVWPTSLSSKPKKVRYILNFPPKDKTKEYEAEVVFFTSNPTAINMTDLWMNPLAPKISASLSKGSKLYKKIVEADGIALYENMTVLPRVYSAKTVTAIKDVKEARHCFWETDLNIEQNTLVENLPQEILNAKLTKLDILETDYQAEYVGLKVKNDDGPAFLVITDRYDSDWSVKIDGQDAKIYKVNGFCRGVFIPEAGEHNIEFRYKPRMLRYGIITSLVFACLMLIVLAIGFFLRRRNPKPINPVENNENSD